MAKAKEEVRVRKSGYDTRTASEFLVRSNRIFHIDNVDKTIKAEFECCECQAKAIAG